MDVNTSDPIEFVFSIVQGYIPFIKIDYATIIIFLISIMVIFCAIDHFREVFCVTTQDLKYRARIDAKKRATECDNKEHVRELKELARKAEST